MSFLESLIGRKPTAQEQQEIAAEVGAATAGGGQATPLGYGTVGLISATAPAVPTVGGVPMSAGFAGNANAMSSAEREELQRLRADAERRDQEIANSAQTMCAAVGQAKAEELLRAGKITAAQLQPFTAALTQLSLISTLPGIKEQASVKFGMLAANGQPQLVQCSLFEFFTAALESKEAAGWQQEVVPQPAGMSALFTRTETTPSNPDAPGAVADDRIARIVAMAGGKPTLYGAAK